MSRSLAETSYTRATPSEITKFQESLAKCDEQFLKLRYPPGAGRSCSTLSYLSKRVSLIVARISWKTSVVCKSSVIAVKTNKVSINEICAMMA